jgi:hypothetical protein
MQVLDYYDVWIINQGEIRGPKGSGAISMKPFSRNWSRRSAQVWQTWLSLSSWNRWTPSATRTRQTGLIPSAGFEVHSFAAPSGSLVVSREASCSWITVNYLIGWRAFDTLPVMSFPSRHRRPSSATFRANARSKAGICPAKRIGTLRNARPAGDLGVVIRVMQSVKATTSSAILCRSVLEDGVVESENSSVQSRANVGSSPGKPREKDFALVVQCDETGQQNTAISFGDLVAEREHLEEPVAHP